MKSAAIALFILLLIRPAVAEPAFAPGGEAQLRDIVDGMTLDLADGRRLRLVGIETPPRGLLAQQAKAALAELLSGGTMTLRFAGNSRDRQDRVLAQVYVGAVWVQGELLKRGFARVRSTADNRAGIAEMLALERQARRHRRGLWSERTYAVVDADEAARFAGTFQLVGGTVDNIRTASGETFLAFGPDRRSAFTLILAPAALKLCREAGLDPAALAGKRLLVRGFIDGSVRPTMAITHPEQIELLRPKRTAPKQASGPR
jgi:endonuclease YncB( thermonuclease family)